MPNDRKAAGASRQPCSQHKTLTLFCVFLFFLVGRERPRFRAEFSSTFQFPQGPTETWAWEEPVLTD